VRALVVRNPQAGRKQGVQVQHLIDALRGRDIPAEQRDTRRPGHATEIVTKASDFDTIVVAGGDGTLHEALQGLHLEKQRLAVLPSGTGNDFAWVHGWSTDPGLVATRLLRDDETRLDVGLYEADGPGGPRTGRFHNGAGMGFEAVVNEASHRIHRLHGPAVYVAALLSSLHRYRLYSLSVTWNESSFEGRSSVVSAMNGKRVGGVFHLAPSALQDDGLLDLLIAPNRGLLRALPLAARSLNPTPAASSGVVSARTQKVAIEAPEGLPLHVDGEFIGRLFTRIQLGVLPRALRTFR
jgi:YegS/Rv2252/BmrU family lipid kinase